MTNGELFEALFDIPADELWFKEFKKLVAWKKEEAPLFRMTIERKKIPAEFLKKESER